MEGQWFIYLQDTYSNHQRLISYVRKALYLFSTLILYIQFLISMLHTLYIHSKLLYT